VDFAGVVEAVGDRVVDVKVGDAVVGSTNFSRGQRGSYADTVVVGADQLCVLPAGFDLDVAAALPVAGVTAWMCVVEIGRIREGKRVAVLGASGAVGQFSVQIARKLRGAFVAGVCSAKNAALVRERGADVVLVEANATLSATLTNIDEVKLANDVSITTTIANNALVFDEALGTNTVTLSNAGSATGASSVEAYVLADLTGNDFDRIIGDTPDVCDDILTHRGQKVAANSKRRQWSSVSLELHSQTEIR
jgi:NADPH:quinone reductase-like Zn-dependent oxidoreductase